jgi:hypothetical protein
MGRGDFHQGTRTAQPLNLLHGPTWVTQVLQHVGANDAVKRPVSERPGITFKIVNNIGTGLGIEVDADRVGNPN